MTTSANGYVWAVCSTMILGMTFDFIGRARSVHGDRYDYGSVEYRGVRQKVTIGCPEHGSFEQAPRTHMSGGGCPRCATERAADAHRMDSPAFVRKAQEKHGDRYGYDGVQYVRNDIEVLITCPDHGAFMQKPVTHLRGKGCPQCGHERRVSPMRMTPEGFIAAARSVHGDAYDYALTDFSSKAERVVVTCPEHGGWSTLPETHLLGKGCPRCGSRRAGDAMRGSAEEFVAKAVAKHGPRYDYSLVDYRTAREHVSILCPEHGEFRTAPYNHLSGHGCPRCAEGCVSRVSQAWLDSIGVQDREVPIPGTPYRADGFDAATGTVYEFLGCFWHGCPRCHDPLDVNVRTGTTYASLLSTTRKRESEIVAAGFSVVAVWEHSFTPGVRGR